MEFLPSEINSRKVYAGFAKRFGAGIVDMLTFIPFIIAFSFFESWSITMAIVGVVLSGFLFSGYTICFHYRFGATLGKMALGIKVTLPNGAKIGLKQALLRSSVDVAFSLFLSVAQIIAITHSNPEVYLNASWLERAEYTISLYPVWYTTVDAVSQIWYWSEFIVLLFNKRKRALHDFIAGTVVIHQEYAKQVAPKEANSAVFVS